MFQEQNKKVAERQMLQGDRQPFLAKAVPVLALGWYSSSAGSELVQLGNQLTTICFSTS